MSQSVSPFELVAWRAGTALVVCSEVLSDTGARLGSYGYSELNGGRIEIGLRHVTAAGPVLVPCASVAVPGPPGASDPKKSKTLRAQASDGAGWLTVAYSRGSGGWSAEHWHLEYDPARSRSPTMRAYCAHVPAKRAAIRTRYRRRQAEAELEEVGREETLLAASVAEMEGVVR